MQNDSKIRPTHLSRNAYVYVRQSSHYQVRHNLESQHLQYGLADQAKALGFKDVIIIDEDLAVSAEGYVERHGFKKLVTAVSMSLAGIILGTETARLARNGRDWHQLLDLCALFDTLLVEQGAVYDPADPNDRMVLSLKGTMSELELNVMKTRLLNGARNKAERGELVYRLPVGYIKTSDGKIEKDPDKRVQETIAQVFSKFRETRSARQTFLWFKQEEIAFPCVRYGKFGKETVWKSPVFGTILGVLKNPAYGGAYANGMRETRKHLENGEIKKTKGHPLEMEDWRVLIKDHHPSYISWEEYEENCAVLRENAKRYGHVSRGPVLPGGALLAGLLRCRRCGRKLQTTYGGKKGKVPRYECKSSRLMQGEEDCIAFGGFRVDQAISREVVRVVEPVATEAAFEAIENLHRDVEEKKRLLTLELESARYEERRAYHQYNAVDPANRLVCQELESKWNESLKRAEHIKSRLSALDGEIRPVSEQTKQEIMQMADELPELWNAPSTSDEMRKRIIRTVIEEVFADVDRERALVVLNIHWMGGIHTKLEVPKNKTGEHRHTTDKTTVDIVAQLAKQLPDERIAPILNRLGRKTGAGNAWTRGRVRALRSYNKIPSYSSKLPRELMTMREAADRLNVSAHSVRGLIEQKLISAHQVVPYAPWSIPVDELKKKEVREAVDQIKRGTNRRKRFAQSQSQPNLL
jgi:DNA invertase Pin-like site-specific DNA recombinase